MQSCPFTDPDDCEMVVCIVDCSNREFSCSHELKQMLKDHSVDGEGKLIDVDGFLSLMLDRSGYTQVIQRILAVYKNRPPVLHAPPHHALHSHQGIESLMVIESLMDCANVLVIIGNAYLMLCA